MYGIVQTELLTLTEYSPYTFLHSACQHLSTNAS
jgi:hypothetical protein